MGDDDDDDDDAAGWTVQQPSKGFTSSLLNFSRGVDDFHVPYMCTYVRTSVFRTVRPACCDGGGRKE